MWLKLDLDGISFQLQIQGYRVSSKEENDYQWCKTDFSFTSGDWLNYSKNNVEIFLSSEVEELAHKTEKLLKDELTEVTTME